MYNRYIRNDHGAYTRIPEEEPTRTNRPPAGISNSGDSRHSQQKPGEQRSSRQEHPQQPEHTLGQEHTSVQGPSDTSRASSPRDMTENITRPLRRLLDRFHLDSIDSGDLLLLLLLFLLFKEDADEELLFALGLLLIL